MFDLLSLELDLGLSKLRVKNFSIKKNLKDIKKFHTSFALNKTPYFN